MKEEMQAVIASLTRQRDLINQALESLLALQGPVPSSAGFSCPSHPETQEFSKKGVCKACQSERMHKYWDEQRQKKAVQEEAAPASSGTLRTFRRRSAATSEELLYSKKQRCPKCSLTTRFHRSPTASPNDYWTCLETGCELKISNYKIPVDREYRPAGDSEEVAVALS